MNEYFLKKVIVNILTFDIEEWYLEKEFGINSNDKYKEFDRILNILLEELDKNNIKATFFCLGKMAEEFPEVILKIHSHGHEIGCHSLNHSWVNKMNPDCFREDTIRAVKSIENLVGKKVFSYRAPAFSICETNKWAFEILADCGIINDASVFPVSRDFGGFPSFTKQKPVKISYRGVELNEFPIPLGSLPLLNKKLAFSGGGYFRLLPYSLIKNMMKHSDYNMCYFHIGDLVKEKSKFLSRAEYETYFKEVGSYKNRISRYMKSNVGRNKALYNLNKLITEFEFISIEEYVKYHSKDEKWTVLELKD